MTYPHQRLRELVQDWTEIGSLSPAELLTAAHEIREYVLVFLEEAAAPTGIEETELIYEGVRLSMQMHLQACDLLIAALAKERMEDSEQVLQLAAAGDYAGEEADAEAERLREVHGFVG